jgi:uncharacterized RDD family membrane protein YckC
MHRRQRRFNQAQSKVQQQISIPTSFAPTVKRRLICMIYEALLLFGVVAVAFFIFIFIAQTVLTIVPENASKSWQMKFWLFLVMGAYFVYFWSQTGQTLAMKTWRIRVVDNQRVKLPLQKAVVRYGLAWMWFLPGLAIAAQFGLKHWGGLIAVSTGFTLWACTAFFDKDKQFLHDKLAKTRLIHVDVDQALSN